jgi:hypothetical protein
MVTKNIPLAKGTLNMHFLQELFGMLQDKGLEACTFSVNCLEFNGKEFSSIFFKEMHSQISMKNKTAIL